MVGKTCGGELEALTQCSVTIRFAPTSGSPASGALRIGSNVLTSPTVAVLSGNNGTWLSVNDVSSAEGNAGTTNAQLTVARSGNLSAPSSLVWSTVDGSATAGSDYVGVAPTIISFAAGEATKTLSVPVKGDTTVEPDESFSVKLTEASAGSTIDDDTAVVTITNDDRPPTITVGDVKVSEGDGGTRIAYLPVTLSHPSTATVTVGYATANGTAVQPADYTAKSGTLSFTPGHVSAHVAVTIRGDTADEGTEQFKVTLASATNATIADGLGLGSVFDDDPSSGLRLTIGDVTISEGDGGGRTASLTVGLSAPSASTVTVGFSTANLEAVAPGDYVAKTGTITFNPGVTTRTVAVSVKADTAVEVAERLKVVLSSPTGGASITDSTGVVTIRNDD